MVNAVIRNFSSSSKSQQKLLALLVLTLAVFLANGYNPVSLPGMAKGGADKQKKIGTLTVGKAAPDFKLNDVDGKTWRLKDLKGKVVVLEWFNHGCPFVKKHYDSGNMQSLQKRYTAKNVVWLSICSSAEGNQGFESAEKHKAMFRDKKSAPTAVLTDPTGRVGRLYGAKTTPHMFIIGKTGKLLYQGAIDNNASGFSKEEVLKADNYVAGALDRILAGKSVTDADTKSYGCSVKYSKKKSVN